MQFEGDFLMYVKKILAQLRRFRAAGGAFAQKRDSPLSAWNQISLRVSGLRRKGMTPI